MRALREPQRHLSDTVDEEGPLFFSFIILPRTHYNHPYKPILLPLAEPSTYDLSLMENVSTSNSNSNNINNTTTPTIFLHCNLEQNVSYWIGYCHIRSVSYQNCIAVPWNSSPCFQDSFTTREWNCIVQQQGRM
jgi:hypothetical protein